MKFDLQVAVPLLIFVTIAHAQMQREIIGTGSAKMPRIPKPVTRPRKPGSRGFKFKALYFEQKL